MERVGGGGGGLPRGRTMSGIQSWDDKVSRTCSASLSTWRSITSATSDEYCLTWLGIDDSCARSPGQLSPRGTVVWGPEVELLTTSRNCWSSADMRDF